MKMTTYTNPVTNEEFDEIEPYVQSLVACYQKAKQEQYKWGQNESKVLNAWNTLADEIQPDLKKGKITLTGTASLVVVEKKVNASYPKDRGAEHPLRKLLPQHDAALRPMVKVDYKESGAQIQGLVDRCRAGKLRPDDNEELARALLEVRIEKPGKIGIKIEDRIDVPTDNDDSNNMGDASATELY